MGYTPKKTQSLFEREAALMSELSAGFIATCMKRAKQQGLTETEAQDLAQDIFCKVLNAIKKNGVSEEHNLLGFMFFSYHRAVLSKNKAKKVMITHVTNEDGSEEDLINLLVSNNPNPLRMMMAKEMFDVLKDVLAQESQVVKDTWSLYENEYKYREIAEMLNLNINTVASYIKRVKDKVLPILKEKGLDHLYEDEGTLGKGEQDDEENE